jgi:hypothetical protein
MATELQLREKRRGDRVLIRIPVQVKAEGEDGSAVDEPAETVVVSRYGALLRTTKPLEKGSYLTLTNGFSREVEKFRVVWLSEKQPDGQWDVGVEATNPQEDFWGIRFPPATPKV